MKFNIALISLELQRDSLPFLFLGYMRVMQLLTLCSLQCCYLVTASKK